MQDCSRLVVVVSDRVLKIIFPPRCYCCYSCQSRLPASAILIIYLSIWEAPLTAVRRVSSTKHLPFRRAIVLLGQHAQQASCRACEKVHHHPATTSYPFRGISITSSSHNIKSGRLQSCLNEIRCPFGSTSRSRAPEQLSNAIMEIGGRS